MNKKLLLGVLGVAVLLTGCPSVHSPLSEAAKGGSWQNIGVSTNSNVLHELDRNSIKKSGNLVTFRDRKTIDNVANARFVSLPAHKTSINTWEANCKNNTYTLTGVQLFDKSGQSVYKQDYDKNSRTAMSMTRGSAIEKQIDAACK